MYLDEWVSINLTSKVYYRRKRDETKNLLWMPYLSRSMKKKKRYLLGGDSVEHL